MTLPNNIQTCIGFQFPSFHFSRELRKPKLETPAENRCFLKTRNKEDRRVLFDFGDVLAHANPDRATLEKWVKDGLISAKDAGIEPSSEVTNNSHKELSNKVKPEKRAEARLALSIHISPITLKSEANAGGKLRDKLARKSTVKATLRDCLPDMRFPLPCTVKLIRIGSKKLDSDNLPMSLKAVRDMVSAWLSLPNDDDPRVRWEYGQKAGYVGGCLIRIKTRHI
jgi:hypothetical protein